ncbi:hypothetical protein BJX99DRAFT_253420 [Aspergillus californicus]
MAQFLEGRLVNIVGLASLLYLTALCRATDMGWGTIDTATVVPSPSPSNSTSTDQNILDFHVKGAGSGRQSPQAQSEPDCRVRWLCPSGGPWMTLGPKCRDINGSKCWQMIFQNQSIPDDIVREINQYLWGVLISVGGRAPTTAVGMVLRGPINELCPTVVISCSSTENCTRLKKELDNGCTIAKYRWIVVEISTDFLYKAVPSHCALVDTEFEDNSSKMEETETSTASSGPETIPQPSSIPPRFTNVPLSVFVRRVVDNQIAFPADIYLGYSSRSLRKATIGGLVQLRGGQALYGITVGHTLNRAISEMHLHSTNSDTPGGINGGSETNSDQDYTVIGTVVLCPGKGLLSHLDWALMQFSDAFQVVPSSYEIVPIVSRDMFDFNKDPSDWHPNVKFITTIGSVGGWLGPYPYYIHCPGDRAFMKTLPVTLQAETCTAMGDCGSWVVDVYENRLCGFVSHGAGNEAVTFIVPASDIFVQIEGLIGREVTISPYRIIKLTRYEAEYLSDTEDQEEDEEQDQEED